MISLEFAPRLPPSEGQPPTLVVVDAQQIFVNDQPEVVEAVCRLVLQSIATNAGIVLVETNGCGPTVEKVRTLLDGYPHKALARKASIDGAAEVLDACRENGLSSSAFTLCGVSFACCVAGTALGLKEFEPSAEVVIRVDCTDAKDSNARMPEADPRIPHSPLGADE